MKKIAVAQLLRKDGWRRGEERRGEERREGRTREEVWVKIGIL